MTKYQNTNLDAEHAALALELFKRLKFTGAELSQAVAVHNWLSGFLERPIAHKKTGNIVPTDAPLDRDADTTGALLSRIHTAVPDDTDA